MRWFSCCFTLLQDQAFSCSIRTVKVLTLTMRAQRDLTDSAECTMALECLCAKQLRPKKDLYDAAKLSDVGGRSIAVTFVMANLFYESSMCANLSIDKAFPFCPDTDGEGYVIGGPSVAALVVSCGLGSHKSLFTLGGVAGEAIHVWRPLRCGSFAVTAGNSVYRLSSAVADLEPDFDPQQQEGVAMPTSIWDVKEGILQFHFGLVNGFIRIQGYTP